MEKITEYLVRSTVENSEVRAWEETVCLPTYGTGKEEKAPIFLEKRVYQGSSGAVYPYPVIEKIEDEKKDKPYKAMFIENEFIKVMILPELGGRVQMAYDKVRKRHFVYYNQVIKPALVGLTGPWISGGIEFNWPQHHRPSTFLPTDCTIEEHHDGSKTIWCSEVERMSRTKGMMGFTLYPGKAYIEVNAKVYNRTPFPQTFLWWANPAVVVNDDYYSVFPPDVNAVFDHGKRDVSTFPIATGTYYKVDYSAGVDISRYKNIPVPTSYMAVNSKYDFVGGYDEGDEAGMLHVADHHINAGKKQWTWGNGDFGKAWDRNLTDEDGPYIELMTGIYCDNQPDFAWLQPYEEKSWTQYFMPYQKVGMVKNATKDAIVGVTGCGEDAYRITVYATGIFHGARIVLRDRSDGKVLFDRTVTLSPAEVAQETVRCEGVSKDSLSLSVYDNKGKLLVEYDSRKTEKKPVPEPAKAAKFPEDVENNEQLFLTGQHLEQYRHATYSPVDYYKEALRRDEGDVRCNNAMGLYLMRRGRFEEARPYFERAIQTQTQRNPNPYDGEPYYNLGWCEAMREDFDAAYDAFYKATWNAAVQDSAYMSLAQIDVRKGNYDKALYHVSRSLDRNYVNHRARHLKTVVLRKLGRLEEAERLIEESLNMDKFNVGCLFERWILSGSECVEMNLRTILRGAWNNYLEYSIDYSNAGLWDEAAMLLDFGIRKDGVDNPMVYYALSYYYSKLSKDSEALGALRKAEACKPDGIFPNKLEEVAFLRYAVDLDPKSAKAWYYLGDFWYNARYYSDAVKCWEASVRIDSSFPTVHRNLALAYFNKFNDPTKALVSMEKAYSLDESDSRILMELDQLYKKLRRPHSERLAFLKTHMGVVVQRDDLYVEMVTLLNQSGEYRKAYDAIARHKFHPWEGGEGKITGQYVICRLELAKAAISAGDCRHAVQLLEETRHYPDNLGEGKLVNAAENDIHYYMGCAYEGLGDLLSAREYFEMAAKGSSEPSIAFFYNDQQPDKIFYQGLALRKLGREKEAVSRFESLIAHGRKHMDDVVRIDYFAVSLPDLLIWDEDLNIRNKIHCNFVLGMGYMGMGDSRKAREHLVEVQRLDINHQCSASLLKLLGD